MKVSLLAGLALSSFSTDYYCDMSRMKDVLLLFILPL